jgi:hypothetical protein
MPKMPTIREQEFRSSVGWVTWRCALIADSRPECPLAAIVSAAVLQPRQISSRSAVLGAGECIKSAPPLEEARILAVGASSSHR